MAKDFGEFKLWVVDKLKGDGDSTYPLDTASIAWGTAFSSRCLVYLQQFIRETYSFYARGISVTGVSAGQSQIDMSNLAVACYEPEFFFANGKRVTQQQAAWIVGAYDGLSLSLASNKPPAYWGKLREYVICLDSPIDVTTAAALIVDGWVEHPAQITADNIALQIPQYMWDVMSTFVACMFSKPIVSDEVGAMRLKMYNEEAYNGLMTYRSRNIATFMPALRKGDQNPYVGYGAPNGGGYGAL